MLPDIIDKPLGIFLFGQSIGNGRIYGHTLLFLILIAAAGLWLLKYRHYIWLLALSLGIFFHLVLDQMWNQPATLLWPLLGLTFPRTDVGNWVEDMLKALKEKPTVYIPEIIGAIIVISFVFLLFYRKKVIDFIKNGQYF